MFHDCSLDIIHCFGLSFLRKGRDIWQRKKKQEEIEH